MKRIEKILGKLIDGKRIKRAAVITRDGIKIVPTPKKSESSDAMLATFLALGEHIFTENAQGLPQRVIIENKKHKTIVVGAGPKALLAVAVEPSVNSKRTIEKAAEGIKQALG